MSYLVKFYRTIGLLTLIFGSFLNVWPESFWCLWSRKIIIFIKTGRNFDEILLLSEIECGLTKTQRLDTDFSSEIRINFTPNSFKKSFAINKNHNDFHQICHLKISYTLQTEFFEQKEPNQISLKKFTHTRFIQNKINRSTGRNFGFFCATIKKPFFLFLFFYNHKKIYH